MLRLLLLLYPPAFREDFGPDALRMLRADLSEARRSAGVLSPLVVLRLLADFALQGLLRRWDGAGAAWSGFAFGWGQDIRLAIRSSLRRPGFALVSVVSLAIGVGVNGIMFSVTDSLFLQEIPGVDEPDRILEIGTVQLDRDRFIGFSYPDFLDLRAQAPLDRAVFTSMEAVSLLEDDGGRLSQAMFTSAGYFETLGVRPALGRTFHAGEEVGVGEHPVVILSHRTWMDRFDGRADVLGQTLRVNREPYTVVGVAPADFTGHLFGLYPDLWLPLTQHPAAISDPERYFQSRTRSWGAVLGRMDSGTDLDEVNAALSTIFARLAQEYPESNQNRGARAAQAGMAPADARAPMMMTFALITLLTMLVLAATCANVAGMLLARASAREQEIAIRAALGSPRNRLVRHLMTEAMIVFGVGGAAGIGLARSVLGIDPNRFLPVSIPIDLDFSLDGRLALFGLLLTLGVGLVFGLMPALNVTKQELSSTLRDPAGGTGARASRLRRVFVSAQIAITVLLLGLSGLSLRSVFAWADLEAGFDIDDVYLVSFDLDQEGYDAERGTVFLDDLVAHLEAQPEISAAAVASEMPLDGASSAMPVWPDGQGSERWVQSHFGSVRPGYFEMLGIGVVRGRPFTSTDGADAGRVAVVNEAFAEAGWPDGRAVGRTISFGLDPATYTVVGVVEDTKADGITDRRAPQVFTALAQSWVGDLHLAVRRAPGAEGFNGALNREILSVDPAVALSRVRSMEQTSRVMLLPHRLMAGTASALGALALFLSALGLYGVIAFAVTRQTREIGVRIALGAGRGKVIGRVVGSGLLLALPGTAIGLLLSLTMGQVIQGILPVSAFDPITYAGTMSVLVVVVLTACLAPALRAASIHPMEALRFE